MLEVGAHQPCWLFLQVLFMEASAPPTIMTASAINAAAFIFQFEQDYRNNPANTEAIYYSWALGFLSGMNSYADTIGSPRRDLAAMPFENKKEFIRNYCDQHPLQLCMVGVLQLGLSLPFGLMANHSQSVSA